MEPWARRVEPGTRRMEPGTRRVEAGTRRMELGARRVEAGARQLEPWTRRVEAGRAYPGVTDFLLPPFRRLEKTNPAGAGFVVKQAKKEPESSQTDTSSDFFSPSL